MTHPARLLPPRSLLCAADEAAAEEAAAAAGGGGGKKKKAGGGKAKAPTQFAHTLNATACAVPRMIVAILENFQQVGGCWWVGGWVLVVAEGGWWLGGAGRPA